MGVSENRGTPFGGPYTKDPTIGGTILGSPIFGNYHLEKDYKGFYYEEPYRRGVYQCGACSVYSNVSLKASSSELDVISTLRHL